MKQLGFLVLGFVLMFSANTAHALSVGVGDNNTITIGADVSANAGATTSNDSTGTGTQTSVSGSVGDSAVLLVTKADADASATTISSPLSVQSKSDLSAYVSGAIRADADAGDAELSDNAVSLGYKQRAKLFGFIPVFVHAVATVHAGGETTVQYPWYAVFTTTDSASLRSDVEAATADTVSAQTHATFSASTQAQLLAEMKTAMKSHLQASLAADMQASTSTQ